VRYHPRLGQRDRCRKCPGSRRPRCAASEREGCGSDNRKSVADGLPRGPPLAGDLFPEFGTKFLPLASCGVPALMRSSVCAEIRASIVRKHSLQPLPYEQVSSWPFADAILRLMEYDNKRFANSRRYCYRVTRFCFGRSVANDGLSREDPES